ADADELVEDLLVRVVDGVEALEHVLMCPAQVEHRVGMVGQEFLGAVGRFLVNLQPLVVDHFALVHPVDKFHQRGHAGILSSNDPPTPPARAVTTSAPRKGYRARQTRGMNFTAAALAQNYRAASIAERMTSTESAGSRGLAAPQRGR